MDCGPNKYSCRAQIFNTKFVDNGTSLSCLFFLRYVLSIVSFITVSAFASTATFTETGLP